MGLYDSSPYASSAIGGAASGAAVGSVVPGVGTGAGAAVGLFLGILNGLLGANSQSQANQTNLAIARETNAQNWQQFQESQKFAWDMWKSTNKYNSPAHQRELLKAAGFNPNLLFGYNGSQASALNAPSAPGAQVGNPMMPMITSDSLNNSLSTGVNASVSLSEAALKDAQATGQRIENIYSAKKKENELLLQHDDHTAKAIQNEIDFASMDDKKQTAKIQNENTKVDTLKKLSEQAVNKILEKYHRAKVDEVKEAIQLLVEQQNETAARAKMQEALGSKYLAEKELAQVQKLYAPLVAKSQIAANYASAEASKGQAANQYSQAEVNKKVASYQQMVNDVYSIFGEGKAAQDFLNAVQEEDLKYWQTEDFFQAAKEKGIINSYEDMHRWLRNANEVLDFIHKVFNFGSTPATNPSGSGFR